jgi:hypothetical protein
VLKTYSAADYLAGKTPRAGARFTDPATGLKYIFLYNAEASSAIVAGTCCVSKTLAHREAFGCIIGGQHEGANFAGVRPYGATSLAAGEYAWFIIGGEAYVIASTVTASTAVDLGAAGTVEDFAASGAQIPFATAGDVASGAVTYIWIWRNVWGY